MPSVPTKQNRKTYPRRETKGTLHGETSRARSSWPHRPGSSQHQGTNSSRCDPRPDRFAILTTVSLGLDGRGCGMKHGTWHQVRATTPLLGAATAYTAVAAHRFPGEKERRNPGQDDEGAGRFGRIGSHPRGPDGMIAKDRIPRTVAFTSNGQS